MDLASVFERTYFVDPGGQRAEQVIEHRMDPLTGNVASINPALGEKAKAFLGSADLNVLKELEDRSRSGCPFCNAAEKGTRYVPELVREGQLRVGTALAMPNLFSKCALDSVVILDPRKHVVFPSKLGREALADAIRAAAELLRRGRSHDPSLLHHVVGKNFLNPSGSSRSVLGGGPSASSFGGVLRTDRAQLLDRPDRAGEGIGEAKDRKH